MFGIKLFGHNTYIKKKNAMKKMTVQNRNDPLKMKVI